MSESPCVAKHNVLGEKDEVPLPASALVGAVFLEFWHATAHARAAERRAAARASFACRFCGWPNPLIHGRPCMKMQPGKLYRLDHPTLEHFLIADGWLNRNGSSVGFVGKTNGARVFHSEGAIHFLGHHPDIPQDWKDSIQISGLIATLPDGQEIAIYENGTERPSTREARMREAERHEALFREMCVDLVNRIKSLLGRSENPEGIGELAEMLHSFNRRADRDRNSPIVYGVLLGLQAASILDQEQRQQLWKLVANLKDAGGVCSDFSARR